jgi:hypothetical protein
VRPVDVVAVAVMPRGWVRRGAGHMMRQLWPLNRASLETGPWYPFDNGPNGVGTKILHPLNMLKHAGLELFVNGGCTGGFTSAEVPALVLPG